MDVVGWMGSLTKGQVQPLKLEKPLIGSDSSLVGLHEFGYARQLNSRNLIWLLKEISRN